MGGGLLDIESDPDDKDLHDIDSEEVSDLLEDEPQKLQRQINEEVVVESSDDEEEEDVEVMDNEIQCNVVELEDEVPELVLEEGI